MDITKIQSPLKGKRYINLVRCSTDEQAETSIPGQLELLNRFGTDHEMVHAGTEKDDLILDGVSGSKPGNRDDIQQAIDRKLKHDDFEVLLVQTEDRLTRGGSAHGIWMQYELSRHGIQVVFVSSDAPDGPYADIVRTLKFQAAEETVKSTSLRSTQGYQRALENRNVATSTHSPYGTHRLYCSADEKPLFLIRDNGDGTQHKLDVHTRAVVDTYGTVGGNARGHYRKQKSEKVFPVMGEEAEVAVVRRLFQRRYMDGIGGRRIAGELNAEGIAAPGGGRWTQRQVEVVTENEVYTGSGVANRVASGRFYQRAKGSPQKVTLDAKTVATKKTIPLRLRPPEDWVYQEQPHLKDFLAEPLRDIAAERIRTLWIERCRPGRQKRPCNPHPDSDYLLTNIIVAKQDGRRLKGYTGGPKGRKVRYYVHPLAQKDSAAAGFPNTTFRADALEDAVLAVLAETLAASSDLKLQIEAAVAAAMVQRQAPDEQQTAKLKEQKVTLSRKIMLILDVIDAGAPEARAKIADLQRQQRQIDDQLRHADAVVAPIFPNAEELVQSIMERLRTLGRSMGSLPPYQLRQVLAALIESMTADMLTREVRISLRIPESAFSDAKTAIDTLSLQQTSASSTVSQTQHCPDGPFAEIVCRFYQESQKPCFECRRLQAAA